MLNIIALENKNQKKSATITASLATLLFLFAYFWVAIYSPIPPPNLREKHYELVGSMDYGDWTEGSQNINTFEKSSPKPDQNKPAPTPTEKPKLPDPTPPDEKQNLTEDNPESPIKEKPKPKPKIKPKDKIKPQEKEKLQPKITENSGGANHGNKTNNETGNRGRPDSPVLDPNGLYSFGTGGDGLNGRVAIATPSPKYTEQQETKVTFEFVIAPSGNVKSVRPTKLGSSPALVNAAKTALFKWKFNKIEADNDQKVKVTFTFKLK